MMSRLLSLFGLAALTVGLASAQDKPADSPKAKVSTKAQVTEALGLAETDLPGAITVLEGALKTSPDDRNALFLLGAMSVVQGDKADDKAGRIEAFRRSTASFAKLQKLYKELTPNEKRFLSRSKVGEARVLVAEGHVDQAFGAIKEALAAGTVSADTLDAIRDLEPVRKLPEYKLAVENAARAVVAEELASFESFPFDFALKDLDQKPVKLADFAGKVTIVDVWGTWCPPCREEIPHFVDLYKQYHDKGLEIVGINCNEQGPPDDQRKTIRAFVQQTKIPYPCVLNDEKTEEKIPGFQGYPTTLFLDRSGKVRLTAVGNPGKAKIEAIVTSLLAEDAKSDESKAK